MNSQDVALWALTLGDACPSLADIKAALAAQSGPVLAPLPAGVSFDHTFGLGVVRFDPGVGIKDPALAGSPYFFVGALKSLQPGSIEYAHVAYNCQTEEFEEQLGWLMQSGKKFPVIAKNILTGLPNFDTSAAENISPPVRPIPAEYDTVEKAVEFINDPIGAKAKYGPK